MQDFYQKLNYSRLPSKQVDNIDKLKRKPTAPKLSRSEIITFNKDLQSFFKYIREIFDKNPEISNEELKQNIQEALVTLNIECANNSSFRSSSLRVDICNYFKEHPSEFKELYKKLIDEEKETGIPIYASENIIYSSNKEQSKIQFLKQLITSYRRLKSSFNENDASFLKDYAKSSPKRKRLIRDVQTSKEIVNFIVKNEMFFTDEMTGITQFFKDEVEFLAQELKKDYINSLKNTYNQLEKFNLFENYKKDHNKQVAKIGLPELMLSDKDISDMKSRLSNVSLSDFSLTELSSLNAFWINRLTKEIISFNTSFFTVSNLDLWDSIRTAPIESSSNDFYDNHIDLMVKDEEIEAVNEKMRFLSDQLTYYYNKLLSDIYSNNNLENNVSSGSSMRTVDLASELNLLQQQIGDDYNKYFSALNNHILNKSDNNLFNDFSLYHIAANIVCNSYSIKSNIMISQLSALFNNTISSKNWGICLEKGKKPNKSSKVVIAIDVPGFNMPFRLHMQRDLLEDFLKANQNTTKIPLYQGENDFIKTINNKQSVITTPILMPISKEYKQTIEKLSCSIPESNKYNNFIKHLNFISNSTSYPEHLKTEPQSKRKKRYPKKEIFKKVLRFFRWKNLY